MRLVIDFWESLASSQLRDQEAIGAPSSPRFIKLSVEGDTILDVGCGYGRFAVPLAEEGKLVVGLDASFAMLRRLRRNSEEVLPVLADARRLPFRSGTFDACISLATLYYIEHWEQAVAEISRVLRRGGRALLDFQLITPRTVAREIVLRTLKRLGWRRPWRYALENKLTTRRHVLEMLPRSWPVACEVARFTKT